MKPPMGPPDETTSMEEEAPGETTSMNEEEAPDVLVAPAPVVVAFSTADFDDMLGSYNEIARHVVIGGDDDHDDRPRARVGRYERRDG